jgi:hypothetical protein
MTTTLVLTDELDGQLEHASQESLETAGVLLASVVRVENGDIRLLGRELHWVESHSYLARTSQSLSIASDGYVPALGKAESEEVMALWVWPAPME